MTAKELAERLPGRTPAAVAAIPGVDCKVSTPEFALDSCFAAMLQAIGVER